MHYAVPRLGEASLHTPRPRALAERRVGWPLRALRGQLPTILYEKYAQNAPQALAHILSYNFAAKTDMVRLQVILLCGFVGLATAVSGRRLYGQGTQGEEPF